MLQSAALRRLLNVAGAITVLLLLVPVKAELNPAAIMIQHSDQIKWVKNEKAGNANAILAGDPTKPGIYVELTRWYPGHMSRPHFHPNDRYIYVLSGTWWVGTGPVYDPDKTTPVPAGSYVTHYGKQVHFDGAKDEEAIPLIVSDGPETPTRAETR